MRPSLPSLLLVLCLAHTALAQNEIPALLSAVSGSDAKTAENAVSVGLKSADPRVRAIAARLAIVRRMTALAPAVMALADRESDVNAAREMVRAMIMLGGLRQVDRGFYISDRFGKRLDADVAIAAAHLGPAAVDTYFSSMKERGVDRFDFFRVALWGHPEAASTIAARLLQTDTDGFQSFLFMNGFEPRVLIDAATLEAGLTHSDQDVRATTAWFLANQALRQRGVVEARLKTVVAGLRVPRDNADVIVSVEVLRRAIGLPKRDFAEFRQALTNPLVQIRFYVMSENGLSLLTESERRLATGGSADEEGERLSADFPPFVLPSALPAGLAEQVLAFSGCNGGWFGTADVQVDDLGLVASRDLSRINTTDACRRALGMLLDFSIAENQTISAPRRSNASFVRAAGVPPCFDESAVPASRARVIRGRSMRFPRVRRSVAPIWPAGVPRKPTTVGVEVMVSSHGCARAVRLVNPSPNAALNAAALTAAQQWVFQPGRVETNPIDMLYDVEVEFNP